MTSKDDYRSFSSAAKSVCKGFMLYYQAHSINVQKYVISALNMPFKFAYTMQLRELVLRKSAINDIVKILMLLLLQ